MNQPSRFEKRKCVRLNIALLILGSALWIPIVLEVLADFMSGKRLDWFVAVLVCNASVFLLLYALHRKARDM